jgi:hypothetical protein
MYELTGNIKELATVISTGEVFLTLLINEKQSAKNLYDELHEAEKLSINIGKYREKRSLNANGYMWTLCGLLAEKMSNDKVTYTKEDIYRDAIKEVGVWYDDEIEPEKVQRRCKAWELIGTGWLTERVDFTADGEKEIIRFYYGSSQYNKKQMSRLIDNIVQDCQAVGIETKTPEELAKMKALWGEQ